MISARTEVACVRVSYVSYVYSKRAALTRALVSFFTNERFVLLLSRPLVEQPQLFVQCLRSINQSVWRARTSNAGESHS